jgi:hypothetical protein
VETCNRSLMTTPPPSLTTTFFPLTCFSYLCSALRVDLVFLPRKVTKEHSSEKVENTAPPPTKPQPCLFLVKTFSPPSLTCFIPLFYPLKHFLKTLDTLFFSLFLWSSRRLPEDFVATTGSCGAQRRATGRS